MNLHPLSLHDALPVARPWGRVIDVCAGAVGKTLAWAAAMQSSGTLLACDFDRTGLSRLGPRAERAGATAIETVLLDPAREAQALERFAGKADAVLVDAPCSGTGTWRRNPEARWRLTEKQLARYAETQARRSEEHTSELQSLMRIAYAVFCLKTKTN